MPEQELQFNISDYEILPKAVSELFPDQTDLRERIIQDPRCRVLNASRLGHLDEQELLDCGWDEETQGRVKALNLQARASTIEWEASKEERQPRYPWISGFNLGMHISGIVDGQREVQRLRYQATQVLANLNPMSPGDYNQLIKDVVRQISA